MNTSNPPRPTCRAAESGGVSMYDGESTRSCQARRRPPLQSSSRPEIGHQERQRMADPPSVVIEPHTGRGPMDVPAGEAPSSENASANPMLMPAPTDAARPTRNASHALCVATRRRTRARASKPNHPSIRRGRAARSEGRKPSVGLVFLSFDYPLELVLQFLGAILVCRSSCARSSSNCRTADPACWPPRLRNTAASHLHGAASYAPRRAPADGSSIPICVTFPSRPAGGSAGYGRRISRDTDRSTAAGVTIPPRASRRTSPRRMGNPASVPRRVRVDALVFFLHGDRQR